MGIQASQMIDVIRDGLVFVLSWIVLTAIAIIISGKLLAKRMPLGFFNDDVFDINLGLLKLKSRGDEVSLGFIVFIFHLCVFIIFGGKPIYTFFKTQAGIDIGQWNSLCIVSSFASILLAFIFYAISGWLKGVPILEPVNRTQMVDRMNDLKEIRDGD